MPLQKNQVLTLTIERLSNDGSGVAHSPDGEAVFIPGTAPGDEADIRIVKDCGRYAFGILDQLRVPSPDRVPVDCAVAGPCGGCSLRHLDYAAELRAKQENVTDAFRRIGGLDVPVLDALPSPEVDRYRNKVQFPVGRDKNGAPCIGFYAGRTHRIVPCPDCKLQPGTLNAIGNALCSFFAANGIQPYDEASGKGLVRHIFLRRGVHSGQIMVCLVCTRAKLPHSDALVEHLTAQFPDIATILVNVNAKNTNVILGSETHTLYGPGFIEDTLCGVPLSDYIPLRRMPVLVCAAQRNGEYIIPNGDYTPQPGDSVYFIGEKSWLLSLLRILGRSVNRIRDVSIVGGSRLSTYLGWELLRLGIGVRIVEQEHEKCLALSRQLPKAMIIEGDGADSALLQQENILGTDAFVAVTGRDEDNLLMALYARRSGVGKVVAKMNRPNYSELVKDIGLDSVVSPKDITANTITRYVRALANSEGSTVESLYKMMDGQVEALEFTAGENLRILHRPLRELRLKHGILLAAISRRGDIIIPDGSTTVEPGDRVVLVTHSLTVEGLDDILA